MTDFQALQLLKTAGIVGARPLHGTARLLLTVRKGDTTLELPLTEYQAELKNDLKLLEEEKQDIQKNVFASRTKTTFTLGGGEPTTLEALKRNEQLSKEEREDKTSRLTDLDSRARKRRGILLALTHLQVHSANLLPKMSPSSPATPKDPPRGPAGKKLWTKGVKAAALHCLREAQRTKVDDQALLLLCKEFLEKYSIDNEPDYSAETLFQNVRQVRLLDTIE